MPTLLLLWTAGFVRRLSVASNTDLQLWYVWPAELPAALFVLAFGLMSLDLLGLRIPSVRPFASRRAVPRTGLLIGGGTCLVVLAVFLSGAVLPRVRARQATP